MINSGIDEKVLLDQKHNIMKGQDRLKITKIYGHTKHHRQKIPLFMDSVPAGFPSPADDFIDKKLDLNRYLIKHPAATFFVRVSGHSMTKAGIHSGDILIVDRALEPINNSVVIALLDGEFTVKRVHKQKGALYLLSENPRFGPKKVTEDMDFQVWGVVTYVIHRLH